MEKHIAITSARQQLLTLTKQVKKYLNKFVLTNKGEPQAVLLSIPEYRGLMAASTLLLHPEVLEDIRVGIKELNAGQGLSLEEAFASRPVAAAATARAAAAGEAKLRE